MDIENVLEEIAIEPYVRVERNRSRGYYRKMRERAINRKKKILGSTIEHDWVRLENKKVIMVPLGRIPEWTHWYEYEGMLSKGKIHCSCPMCSAKTRNKGKRKQRKGFGYEPTFNWTISDRRKVDALNYEDFD